MIYKNLGESVQLSCELYGYLESGPPATILWRRGNDALDPSLIQVRQGSHMIQNGGASPISSVLSVVSLDNLEASMFGTYACRSDTLLNLITLELGKATSQNQALQLCCQ